ncbi:MAG: Na+/H+ antiporter NhaC family protein [Henriciella sp.]|nr:Na+/H+ antiporter NhaC family protein [Henriciella sp.]
MEWLTVLPPAVALIVAVWTRNVFWSLGLAIWLSETLIAAFNPAMGALGSIDRAVSVFGSTGNTRILLFCLIIGALIAYMQRSGGIAAMVEKLHKTGLASTPRRASLVTAIAGVIIFVETNVSLLASGVLGRPLFDRLKVSRARLAYIIDSTCAPVCVLVLLNGWGAYLLSLMMANGVDAPVPVLFQTVALNFYAWLTLAGVFVTIMLNRTFGAMATADANWAPPLGLAEGIPDNDLNETPSRAIYMGVPMLILVGGALGFMFWTGGGDITQGSGSQSILWAVVLATAAAFIFLAMTRRAEGEMVNIGFQGMGDLLPAVTVIFLALVLGDSLRALGTGDFIAGIAASIPAPWTIPAILFVAASVTSFTTGTSWGTYGILVPIAIPLALGAGVPLPLVMAAVIGGGVFGDHCSPISDTTIIASLAAGCDHIEHVKTQLPYALVAGGAATGLYLISGLLG